MELCAADAFLIYPTFALQNADSGAILLIVLLIAPSSW